MHSEMTNRVMRQRRRPVRNRTYMPIIRRSRKYKRQKTLRDSGRVRNSRMGRKRQSLAGILRKRALRKLGRAIRTVLGRIITSRRIIIHQGRTKRRRMRIRRHLRTQHRLRMHRRSRRCSTNRNLRRGILFMVLTYLRQRRRLEGCLSNNIAIMNRVAAAIRANRVPIARRR